MTPPGKVIVVGAGPVGLTTALGLTYHGLEVVVLEEDDRLSLDTKAGTILTRTLEVMDRYGVIDEVLRRSLRIDEIGDVDRETGETMRSIRTVLLSDETRYPFVINIPQHYLEPILAASLDERSAGSIRMGHRVTGFQQTAEGVVVTAQTASGQVQVAGDYLLACDGGRSVVRKQLGIEVEGTTFEEQYQLVDVAIDLDVENPRDYPYLSYFAHPKEWMILVRQPEFWRFLYPRHPGDPELDGQALAEKAREYIGDVGDLDVVGSYSYTVHVRAATRWQDGRAFLMGDAAHLITPMWALGLNTGVLDASNLPWRLAWVLRGWADPSLLEGYEREQQPLATHGSGAMAEAARLYMSGQTQTSAMTDYDWANAMTRTMLAVRLDVAGTGDWQLAMSEATPPPIRPGDRIPDLMVHGDDGPVRLHALTGDQFVALHFTDTRRRPRIPDSTPALAQYAVSRWDPPLDSGLRDRALLDIGDAVLDRLGCEPDTTVLLRPDAHVVSIAPRADGSAERAYLQVTGRDHAVSLTAPRVGAP